MKFDDFLENRRVRKGKPDIQLTKSMIAMSMNHILTAKSIKLDNSTCSIELLKARYVRQ